MRAQFVRLPCAQSDKLVASYCSNLPSKYVKHQHITVTIRYLATIRTSYCKTAVLTLGRTRLFLDDEISPPVVFCGCSFIPRTRFETSLVVVSFYDYEI